MKLRIFLHFALLASMLDVSAFAATEIVDGITWRYTVEDGEASICNAPQAAAIPTSTIGAVEVPTSLGGFPVTSIGRGAFYGCGAVSSVSIPDGVRRIEDNSFDYCANLYSIDIPASVTNISTAAFEKCSGIYSFSVATGNPAYSSSHGLLLSKDGSTLISGVNGHVAIPAGVTRIADCAFQSRQWLYSVFVPDSVTNVGCRAFYGCGNLGTGILPINTYTVNTYTESQSFSVGSNLLQFYSGMISHSSDGELVLSSVTIAFSGDVAETFVSDESGALTGSNGGTGFVSATGWSVHFQAPIVGTGKITVSYQVQVLSQETGISQVTRSHGLHPGQRIVGNGLIHGLAYILTGKDGASNSERNGSTLIFSGKQTREEQQSVYRNGSRISEIAGTFSNISDRIMHLSSVTITLSGGSDETFTCDEHGVLTGSHGGTGAVSGTGWSIQLVTAIPDVVKISVQYELEWCASISICDDFLMEIPMMASVTIPPNVEAIGEDAFGGCSGLAELYLPRCFEGRTESLGVPPGCDVEFFDAVPLVVVSDVEGVIPAPGIYEVPSGFAIRCSREAVVTNPVNPDVRDVCLSHVGTGSVICNYDLSTTTDIIFTPQEESSITWLWERQERVGVTAVCGLDLWSASWVAIDDETATGRRCLRSGDVAEGASSIIEAVVTGPGSLAFDWKIDAGRGDIAFFRIDGENVAEIKRASDWTSIATEIGDGAHTLTWMFASRSAGEGAAFLANVVYSPRQESSPSEPDEVGQMTLEEALDAPGVVWTSSGDNAWHAEETWDGEGGYCHAAASGDASGGDSVIETMLLGPGTISWYWMLDSWPYFPSKYNVGAVCGLDFMVDGKTLLWTDSDEMDSFCWTGHSVDIVGDGEHRVSFVFWNEQASSSDRAFLDRVSWTGAVPDPEDVATTATVTTPEPVPRKWLVERGLAAEGATDDEFEVAASATAANGRPVWECYVADLDPTDPEDDLKVTIEMKPDGTPVVSVLSGESVDRVYETQGAPTPDGPWGKPDGSSRFFRVKVSLPE